MAQEYEVSPQEVRVGFTKGLLPTVAGLEGSDVQMGFALRFWRALPKRFTLFYSSIITQKMTAKSQEFLIFATK